MWCMFCMSYVSLRAPLRSREGSYSALGGRGDAREFSVESEDCFVGGFFALVRGTLRVRAASIGRTSELEFPCAR